MSVLIHHPVHIMDQKGQISPSSFIPFCEFGGDPSKMSVKVEEFRFPICNSFKPRILIDRLCYQINPNDFKNNPEQELKKGLIFSLDYNEDRQKYAAVAEKTPMMKNLYASLEQQQGSNEALIYLNTIGIKFNELQKNIKYVHVFFGTIKIVWIRKV